MSDLFRQKVSSHAAPQPPESHSAPRPRPIPISVSATQADLDDGSSSSDSSVGSEASTSTLRPPVEQETTARWPRWTDYFEQELYLDFRRHTKKAMYHVYLTPPRNVKEDPLFVCHHGAGSSGLSFAVCAAEIRSRLPGAGVLSLEARSHGSIVFDAVDETHTEEWEVMDFRLEELVDDAANMITLTAQKMGWSTLPPIVLVGHSLGGAVVTSLASRSFALHTKLFGSSLIGYVVLDVVEGSALEALAHMKNYISSRPNLFPSLDEAIAWHLRTRTIRNPRSAQISVPSLLYPSPGGPTPETLAWITHLSTTAPFWEAWFEGMSQRFLTGRGAKMLILAGTDRLDKELMIGQMQGKFQLVVIPEAGHFVHEDVPEKTAGLLVDFFTRNDRSQMVLPPKVSDLIAQGKKV